MTRGLLQCLLFSLVGVMVPCGVSASSPAEKLVCTTSQRGDWMSEARAREIFGDTRYALVKFKVSRGNCYEFYAVDNDGSIVEAYYHPISGEALRFNRVSSAPGLPAYETRSASSPVGKP